MINLVDYATLPSINLSSVSKVQVRKGVVVECLVLINPFFQFHVLFVLMLQDLKEIFLSGRNLEACAINQWGKTQANDSNDEQDVDVIEANFSPTVVVCFDIDSTNLWLI